MGQDQEVTKIVFKYYQKFVSIWGVSANTEPLPFGVQSIDFEINEESIDLNHQSVSSFNDCEVTVQTGLFEETGSDLKSDISENTETEGSAATSSNKKKQDVLDNHGTCKGGSAVPELADKRKNSQNLSAAK